MENKSNKKMTEYLTYNLGVEELNEEFFGELEQKIDSEGGVRLTDISEVAEIIGKRFYECKYQILPGGKNSIIIRKNDS